MRHGSVDGATATGLTVHVGREEVSSSDRLVKSLCKVEQTLPGRDERVTADYEQGGILHRANHRSELPPVALIAEAGQPAVGPSPTAGRRIAITLCGSAVGIKHVES
jgi:hypothetical protein